MTAYATRAQLLDRCNLQRLAQLAVPTGGLMPAVDQVRTALLDGSGTWDAETAGVLADAVTAVDTALADGADLMRSYAVPAPGIWGAAVPPVLVRLNCQLAMHYLAERAGMLAESDGANYGALVKLLGKHASGEVALVPPADQAATTADVAHISSGRSRYGVNADEEA